MNTKTVVLVVSLTVYYLSLIAITGYMVDFILILGFIIPLVSVYYEQKYNKVVPRWLCTITAIFICAYFFSIISLQNMIIPVTHSMILLAVIKFAGNKEVRDYLQIAALSLFIVAASALLGLSIFFLIPIFTILFFTTFQITLLSVFMENKAGNISLFFLKKLMFHMFFLPILSIPLAVAIFIIMPRTNIPLIDLFNQGIQPTTGMTDSLVLGETDFIAEDDSIAFRAIIKQLDYVPYWRGSVLDRYTETSWLPSQDDNIYLSIPPVSEEIPYEIYLEPSISKYLITLDYPKWVRHTKTRLNHKGELPLKDWLYKTTRYKAASINEMKIPSKLLAPEICLDYGNMTENFINFALQHKKNSPKETAFNIFIMLSQPPFIHTLSNLPTGKNALDEFLFSAKKGHCEFFASAMALMLRVNGIPSRIISGFLGGYYLQNSYYAVPNKNAHVWVEAYINGEWVKFDPTPVSSHNYVSLTSIPWRLKLRLFADAINYYWDISIIGYDFAKQLNILRTISVNIKKLGNVKVTAKYIALWLITVLSVATLLFFLASQKKLRRYLSTEHRLATEYFRILKSMGIKREKSSGFMDCLQSVKIPSVHKLLESFTLIYLSYYYKDLKIDRQTAKTLFNLLKKAKKLSKSQYQYIGIRNLN